VFNVVFEAGKWLKWLACNAKIFVKIGKNTLNDFIRKLDKTEGSRPGSPERSADHDLLGTSDQPGPDE